MKIKILLQSFACVLLLSGCFNSLTNEFVHKAKEEPTRLPYNFFLESFIDKRPVQAEKTLIDTLSKREQLPFKEDVFVKSLVHNINGKQLYDYDDATVRVELKDYAAFKEKLNYTLSFYVDVTGFDEKGKVLATGIFSCIAERHEVSAWMDSFTGIFKHDQNPVEQQEEHNEVWNSLYDECLADIAYQFNNKVTEWGRGRRS